MVAQKPDSPGARKMIKRLLSVFIALLFLSMPTSSYTADTAEQTSKVKPAPTKHGKKTHRVTPTPKAADPNPAVEITHYKLKTPSNKGSVKPAKAKPATVKPAKVKPAKVKPAATKDIIKTLSVTPPPEEVVPNSALEIIHYPFKMFANTDTLKLRTTEGGFTVNFGSRMDELTTRMILHVRFTHSPALIANESHIRVLLNQEVVGVIPITHKNPGQVVNYDIEVDPRLVSDFNTLRFQFIGHYTNDSCEDPLNSALWADVSGDSNIEMTVKHLKLSNDLDRFPEPFFDHRDWRRLTLPVVFPAQPTQGTLHSAGILSSWFGRIAEWRNARFPAYLDELPIGHALVFATNASRPSFLAKHPDVNAPTIEMATNPADGISKLLIIFGRDDHDLEVAALALALGHTAFTGERMTVNEVKEDAARQPYDAPKWVRLDRPMKFGELVNSPEELQVFGHVPPPVKINLRISPDLFAWRSRGIPVNLKFRYTPLIRSSESRLVMSINGELVQAFNLLSSGEGGEHRVRLPLIDSALFGSGSELFIPPYKLGIRNELQYSFSFAFQKEGYCKDTQVENVRAMLDPDSTVDMTGFPHYAEMPNLIHFSALGFPFTKYADLQQTVIVVPAHPNKYEIETLLTVLGHMGESTGYPATRYHLATPDEENQFRDTDILVIGSALQQGIPHQWENRLPAVVTETSRRISQPNLKSSLFYDWLGFDTQPDPRIADQEKLFGTGPLGAVVGFESPVTAKRNVVAITATAPENLRLVLNALDKPELSNDFRGSVAVVHPDRVDGVLVGQTYFIGHLPFWTAIWFPLSGHPVLLAIFGVLAVLVFALGLWRSLKAVATKRLKFKK